MAKNSDKVDETVTQEVEAPVAKAPYQGNRIYIGPTQPGYKLVRNAVFYGELPPTVEQYLEENPHLRRLIVPTAEYTAAVARMNTKGTPEFDAANR